MKKMGAIIKENDIESERKKEWRDSPTVKAYTDFSKLDISDFNVTEKVLPKERGAFENSNYQEFFEGVNETPLNIIRKFQNFNLTGEVDGDGVLEFGKNDSLLGSIKVRMRKNSRLKISMGDYKLSFITLFIECEAGSNNQLELESNGCGITYARIKETLRDNAKLSIINKHIKDSFLFLYGDCDLGENASVDSKIYVYADEGAHYDCVQNVLHSGLGSKSNVSGRGVVDGPSSLIFRGMLKIHKEKCSGNFETKTINLSDGDAFTDSVPMLDIKATNVSARHSSAIEDIDKAELFYLASRGFSEKEASKLIIDSMLTLTD